jgi:peptidoglycan/xylan/chitin deacetylase (PgdA/CDA1 family)
MLLIVNYHYIREDVPKSGIHPVTPIFFKKQLELINKNGYEFVSLADINNVIHTKENRLPKKCCLITFDDGLRESYEIGLPILDKMGIPAAFFVISDTIIKDELINVHKLHYLRTKISDMDIQSSLKNDIKKLDDYVVSTQYPFDNILTGRIKYLLNFIKPELINTMFLKFIETPEQDVAKKLYMSIDQLQDLCNRGYMGTHSKAHKPLAKLPAADMYKDIKESVSCIENHCGNIESISYPYGEESAVDETVKQNCEKIGLVSGFTMFRGLNNVEDVIRNPLMIKRFDTNEVFGGKNEGLYENI